MSDPIRPGEQMEIGGVSQQAYDESLFSFWLEMLEKKRDQATTEAERQYFQEQIDRLWYPDVTS